MPALLALKANRLKCDQIDQQHAANEIAAREHGQPGTEDHIRRRGWPQVDVEHLQGLLDGGPHGRGGDKEGPEELFLGEIQPKGVLCHGAEEHQHQRQCEEHDREAQ
jgi:hypothetical protein